LDKSFGYSKSFSAKYELGEEIGRGHFGHTCRALIKKGEFKGLSVAVKVISKAKVSLPLSLSLALFLSCSIALLLTFRIGKT
jgi:serine/threonine protein kinase